MFVQDIDRQLFLHYEITSPETILITELRREASKLASMLHPHRRNVSIGSLVQWEIVDMVEQNPNTLTRSVQPFTMTEKITEKIAPKLLKNWINTSFKLPHT